MASSTRSNRTEKLATQKLLASGVLVNTRGLPALPNELYLEILSYLLVHQQFAWHQQPPLSSPSTGLKCFVVAYVQSLRGRSPRWGQKTTSIYQTRPKGPSQNLQQHAPKSTSLPSSFLQPLFLSPFMVFSHRIMCGMSIVGTMTKKGGGVGGRGTQNTSILDHPSGKIRHHVSQGTLWYISDYEGGRDVEVSTR